MLVPTNNDTTPHRALEIGGVTVVRDLSKRPSKKAAVNTPTNIRVMISSRSRQLFPYKDSNTSLLSHVREDLAVLIKAESLFDEPLFEPWINEPASATADDIWDECMARVQRADILVVIYSGDAGWAKEGGEIGICHAELEKGLNSAREKVRILQIEPLAPLRKGADGKRDQLFRDFVQRQQPFTGTPCKNGEELIALCRRTLRESVAQMVRLGVREASRGKFYMGEALDWTRLDFRTRRQTMENVLAETLMERYKGRRLQDLNKVTLTMTVLGRELLVVCSAIPGAYSIPEARDQANQLFLNDWRCAPILKRNTVGPVHFVACNRSMTEPQAMRQLGFADATIVNAPFGVYVADDVQKMQLVYLTNCRDDTILRYQVQRAFDWLELAKERANFLERAAARARIVQAIAIENTSRL
jgi:hypothetical protein